MTVRVLALLIAALLTGRIALAQPAASTPLTLQAAIDQALAASPTIAAARAAQLVDLVAVDIARERLNPEGRVEIERETPKQTYTVALPLETAGKRTRRIAVAHASVQTGEALLAQTVFDLRSDVRRAYFERRVADARLSLLDELRGIAQRARDAAQQRFTAGDAPRLELVQAELALSQADNETTGARGAAEAARIRLNALLALPLGAPTPLATPVDAGAVPVADAAVALAQAANTELAVLTRRIDEQRARVALARALQTPDITPEFTVTRGSEPEFSTGWRAAVAIGLPLFTRHRALVSVEETSLSRLTLERDALLARVAGQVASAATLADAQRRAYLRYQNEIVPQTLEVERMAEDSYRLGQTGIAALLLALQASRDVRLRSLQAASDFQSALADLERATGAPLP